MKYTPSRQRTLILLWYVKRAVFIIELKWIAGGQIPLKIRRLFLSSLIYRRVKPDIILHYTIKPNVYGTIAASMLGIPVVNNVCGLGTVFLKIIWCRR